MILPSALQAFVCRDRVDMRCGVDGLSQLVTQAFDRDPFGGQVFIFIGKRRDKAKLLWWHHTGFLLLRGWSGAAFRIRRRSQLAACRWPR